MLDSAHKKQNKTRNSRRRPSGAQQHKKKGRQLRQFPCCRRKEKETIHAELKEKTIQKKRKGKNVCTHTHTMVKWALWAA